MTRKSSQAELEAALRARLDANPNDFRALVQLARLMLGTGRRNKALGMLDRAAAISPGHATPFTLKAKTLFRDHFGPPPPPQPFPAGKNAISMRQLGDNGKFGNQLFQYAFLRLYARSHGLVALAPDWIGRDLFGFDDPIPGPVWPSVNDETAGLFAPLKDDGAVFANCDLTGYFCRHTAEWNGGTAAFRALYRPIARVEAVLQRALARLHARGKTLVGIHVRRGDFGYGPFWIAPTSWYQAWLDGIWGSLDRPVLYVASDDPQAVREFRRYGAVSSDMLGVSLPGAGFYLDHYLLSQANLLAISNSSFSFTAAMLNEKGRVFVRPDPDQRSLTAFEPWNASTGLQPDISRHTYSPDEDLVITQWIGPRGLAVHVGDSCSAWTVLIRKRHPQLRIIELAGEETLDLTCGRRGLKHINHLIIENGAQFDRVLAGSAKTIRQGHIDAIHFRGNPDPTSRKMLEARGYGLFAMIGGDLQSLTPALANLPNPRMAIQKRLLTSWRS